MLHFTTNINMTEAEEFYLSHHEWDPAVSGISNGIDTDGESNLYNMNLVRLHLQALSISIDN
jgi:hypothetical protein